MKRIGKTQRTSCDRKAPARVFVTLLASAAVLGACYRTTARSTVADVCQNEDGAFVAIEGFLQLPNFLEAEINPETEVTTYELLLAAEPDGRSSIVKTRIPGTRGNKTNRIAELPGDGYTQRDLRIFTASGETVSASDRVRVSGELKKGRVTGLNPCVVNIEKVERP